MTGVEICFVAAAQAAPGAASGLSAVSAAYSAWQRTRQAQGQTKQTQAVVGGLVVVALIGSAVLLAYLSLGRASAITPA